MQRATMIKRLCSFQINVESHYPNVIISHCDWLKFSRQFFIQTLNQLHPVCAIFTVLRAIDVIHKWLPINYCFVLVQISLPSLIVMSKIENNSCSKVRLGRLIMHNNRTQIKEPPFMNKVYLREFARTST